MERLWRLIYIQHVVQGIFVCFWFHIHKKERCFCGGLVLYECENLATFDRELFQSDVISHTAWTNTEQTLCRATIPRYFHIQQFVFCRCSLILTLNQIFQIHANHSISLYLFDLFQIFAAAHGYQRNVRRSVYVYVYVYGWHFNCYVSRMSTCQRNEQRLPFP